MAAGSGRQGVGVCFSPEADLAGGVIITVIGVDAVRHIDHRREVAALAWLPLLLGAHQFIEALIWLWLEGHLPREVGRPALWAYLLIAFAVLPAAVPLAVVALEPTRLRKLLMAPFAALGAVVAALMLTAVIRGPAGVRLAPYHLAYDVRPTGGFLIGVLYVTAVCAPLLLSGYRHVAIFGIVNLVAVAVIAKLIVSGFASVWCAWAAVSSGAIALHLRLGKSHRRALAAGG